MTAGHPVMDGRRPPDLPHLELRLPVRLGLFGLARRCGRAVAWYLRELTGESDYDRYLAHRIALEPSAKVMSRREFERWRLDRRSCRPGDRCC